LLELGSEYFFFSLLSKNIKIELTKLLILLAVCEFKLTLREEHRLRVLKNMMLRKM